MSSTCRSRRRPTSTFQSSLAENVQAEANLRLRGTALNPALLGRINITQGQLIFFGTKYTIDQGPFRSTTR